MSVKNWNNLTKYLQNLLDNHNGDAEGIMEAWTEGKAEVMKMLGGTSTRKKKDPNAPKKGLSSYFFFCRDVRAKVKEDNPDKPVTEHSKIMGKMWKELSAKKKKKYEKQAAEDKARYLKEMEDYTPPPETEETKPKKKERTGPKKPLSSYMFYSKDVRPQVREDNPEMKFGDIAREISRRWKELDEEEKTLFEDLAAKDKERYAQECEEAGISVKAATKKKAAPKKKAKKAQAKKAPAKKKKPEPVSEDEEEEVVSESEEEEVVEAPKPAKKRGQKKRPTGYILFCQENRPTVKKDNPKWKVGQVTKELNKRWKDLDEDERDEFDDRALAGETVTK